MITVDDVSVVFQDSFPQTIFVPCAGTGSRLGVETKYLNKSIVPVGDKPALSRILDFFGKNKSYLIALGYRGDLVRTYLRATHPDIEFQFVDISPYEGVGANLGVTIEQVREYLQEPFCFCACDTLVEGINSYSGVENQIFVHASAAKYSHYRTVAAPSGSWCDSLISEKGNEGKPYIGMASIRSHQAFWDAWDDMKVSERALGEVGAINKMVSSGVQFDVVEIEKWFDTGSTSGLESARRYYGSAVGAHILPKGDEAIWFDNGKVIKFFNDEKIAEKRVERSKTLLPTVPEIEIFEGNLYFYRFIKGEVFSRRLEIDRLRLLLEFYDHEVLSSCVDLASDGEIKEVGIRFYKEKTLERALTFLGDNPELEGTNHVNGISFGSIESVLNQIDWDFLIDGIFPVKKFHGDFHFENIICTANEDFKFLDWRQEFGGQSLWGDAYYDFAKLAHGMLVEHKMVSSASFSFKHLSKSAVEISIDRSPQMSSLMEFFEQWLGLKGFSRDRVRLLTALIFLNIACLHHQPYSKFLFFFGIDRLIDVFGGRDDGNYQ